MKFVIQKVTFLIGIMLLTSCAANRPAQDNNVVAIPVPADQIVFVPSIVPYAESDTAAEDIRSECKWNTSLPRYMEMESEGHVKALASPGFDAATGKKLQLVAVNLHVVGGAGFTGPKWLVVMGKLTEGDRLLGSFEARRQTQRGSWRACSTLESLGEDIAKDIMDWLEEPRVNANLGDAR